MQHYTLGTIAQTVDMLCVVIMSVIMLSVVFNFYAVQCCIIMLSAVMLNAVRRVL
jgi:hypothetical protein